MGDYTKAGAKIGTCGAAYYATKEMIQAEHDKGDTSDDIRYYLDPKQPIRFAFPFPEYDGKKIGEISNFHEDQRADFFFKWAGESFHKEVINHIHPKGGQGVNLASNCPQDITKERFNAINPDSHTYRLVYQINDRQTGKLAIAAECIYCNTLNVFEEHEAYQITEQLLEEADQYIKRSKYDDIYLTTKQLLDKAEYLQQIVGRILKTYNPEIYSL